MLNQRIQQGQKRCGDVRVGKFERFSAGLANEGVRLLNGEVGVVRHVEAVGRADGKCGGFRYGELGFGFLNSRMFDVQVQRAASSNVMIVDVASTWKGVTKENESGSKQAGEV